MSSDIVDEAPASATGLSEAGAYLRRSDSWQHRWRPLERNRALDDVLQFADVSGHPYACSKRDRFVRNAAHRPIHLVRVYSAGNAPPAAECPRAGRASGGGSRIESR